MNSKNDILLAYAKDAYVAEAYASNTMTEMAKETTNASVLQLLIELRDIVNRKRDKMAMVIRRHGGDVPPAIEGTLTMFAPAMETPAMSTEEQALNESLSLLATGHMMMGTYSGLVNLARYFPNDASTNLLTENLMDTIRMVDKAYANLPESVLITMEALEVGGGGVAPQGLRGTLVAIVALAFSLMTRCLSVSSCSGALLARALVESSSGER
ncbi:MAG: DUF892 family protein [Chloroflexi bacterium]|nr:DUF892 family protein [Chloroflexota bacterium]